jgi:hypothetical protein
MELNAPGLKLRRRQNGEVAYYWVAKTKAADISEYPTKTVRLTGTDDENRAMCRRLQSELMEWVTSHRIPPKERFDGTIRALIRLYQHTPESPYHKIKSNTREMYDENLSIVEKAVGTRQLSRLTGLDFIRWHANFKKPAEDTPHLAKKRLLAARKGETLPPNPERPSRAYKAMQLLRMVIRFGVVLNIKECFRLSTVLEALEFSPPKARTITLTFEQAKAICEKAMEMDRHSMALAQALEFELTLRQIDVIGRWEKTDQPDAGGIVDCGKRWVDGLLWSDIDGDGILNKQTSKNDQRAIHDTMAYPFLRQYLDMVPPEKRIGPVIISETTGRPYKPEQFSRTWRKIARKVGIDDKVWNRDSRAGGVTEGSDAGADIEHLRHHANHKNIQTTTRYNRQTIDKTRTVAELRIAHRGNKNDT